MHSAPLRFCPSAASDLLDTARAARRRSIAFVAIVLLTMPTIGDAQDRSRSSSAVDAFDGAPPPQDPARAWRDLQREIANGMPIGEQLDRLRAFLAAHDLDEGSRRSGGVLGARLALGSLYLARYDAERAMAEFETALALAGVDAVDLRGRALYGAAQCSELRDDTVRAIELYERIGRELAGTRYADFARVGLRRLRTPAASRARAGAPAPEFGPVLDLQGSAHRLADLRGRPALLVFADPSDPVAWRRVTSWIAAARAQGMANDAILVFTTGSESAPETEADTGVRISTVPARDGFLSAPLLEYSIRSVPSNAMIGPDGMLIGRDMPTRRITECLDLLRRN